MKMPTHVVIDTNDGWTWAKDASGTPFTEETATKWADMLNDERKPEYRTFVVCSVIPVMSPELMTAIIRDTQETATMIEGASYRCHGCGRTLHSNEEADDHKNRHGLVTNLRGE